MFNPHAWVLTQECRILRYVCIYILLLCHAMYLNNCRNYFVKLFYRRDPDSEVVEQLNATSTLTLEDFEK